MPQIQTKEQSFKLVSQTLVSIQIRKTASWASPPKMLIQKAWGPEFYIPNKSTDLVDTAGLWAMCQGAPL